MRRVPELIDVWFDSGAMAVAQWGYPFQNQEQFKEQFPADYICEAVDQTRGWFYSQHAIATMLFESVNFKNCICLGLIVDAEGQKMSRARVTSRTVGRITKYGAMRSDGMCTAGPPAVAPFLDGTGGRGRAQFLSDAVERLQFFRDLRQHRRV
jgi:hypothetical protein